MRGLKLTQIAAMLGALGVVYYVSVNQAELKKRWAH